MEKELEIRTLTQRFFDGETTLSEERRLYELYRSAESLPSDLMPLRKMMLDMGSLLSASKEEIPLPLNDINNKTKITRAYKWQPRYILAMAASFLLLFTLGTMWYSDRQKNECVAYVYGERITDQDAVMKEMQTIMASLVSDDATAAMEQQMKELFND